MVNYKKNDFISTLRTMNEENIIYHLKNIKHTPIEIHILKKKLIEIRNNKKMKMREMMIKKIIMKQNETIEKQKNKLIDQQIRFLKEQNKQLTTNLMQQQYIYNNQNTNRYMIDRPISTMSTNENNSQISNRHIMPRKAKQNINMSFINHPALTKMPKKNETELQHPSTVKITHQMGGDHPSMVNKSNYSTHKRIGMPELEELQRTREQDIGQIYEKEQNEDNIDYIKQLIEKRKKNNNQDLIKKLNRINYLVNKINSK